MANCMDMIRDNRKSFTKSFRMIADYVEQHVAEVAFISIQEFSNRTNVSTATIHRFCQEIGLSGYAEFQREVQQYVCDRYNDESSQVNLSDGRTSIFATQCSSNIQVLQEIRANEAVMTVNLEKTADLLIKARRIYIIGTDGDYESAMHAYYDFSKLFDSVIVIPSAGIDHNTQLRTITSDDLLFAISFRVYNRMILDVINYFVKANAKIVTLADKESPFNAFANVCLIPEHTTPSYGSVMKVTIQRALQMTIIQKQREIPLSLG